MVIGRIGTNGRTTGKPGVIPIPEWKAAGYGRGDERVAFAGVRTRPRPAKGCLIHPASSAGPVGSVSLPEDGARASSRGVRLDHGRAVPRSRSCRVSPPWISQGWKSWSGSRRRQKSRPSKKSDAMVPPDLISIAWPVRGAV